MIKTKTAVFILASLLAITAIAGGFDGNKILEILGEDKTGENAQKFKTEFLLDKSMKNPENGIKLTVSREEPFVVTGLLLTNTGYEINDLAYKSFRLPMPFGINWNDNEETLREKLGLPKSSSEEKVKFKKDGITINVFFKNASHKKITNIKFTQNIGTESPYRVDGNHEVIVKEPEPVAEVPAPSKTEAKPATSKPDKMAGVSALPAPAQFSKTTTVRKSRSPFYDAIMSVIESGEDDMFHDIKNTASTQPNFWNYKYTYSTKVAIPGEKYNMLYSFPFQNSQLDFVSVIDEEDASSAAVIQTKYAELEGKLKEEFKLTEGWTYHYIVNRDNPNGLKDFELKNPKLGSIVLDHSVNPYGRQVLYLRFLLQYD
ncbi:MAG: hypothetical protein U0T73_05945 [Chitinophagales bacterium]